MIQHIKDNLIMSKYQFQNLFPIYELFMHWVKKLGEKLNQPSGSTRLSFNAKLLSCLVKPQPPTKSRQEHNIYLLDGNSVLYHD